MSTKKKLWAGRHPSCLCCLITPELCRWKPISRVGGNYYTTSQEPAPCVTGVLHPKMYSISCKEAHSKEALLRSSWTHSRSPQNQDFFNYSDTHPHAIYSPYTLIQS